MIQYTVGILTRPADTWRTVAELPERSFRVLVLHPCILALIPAIAWFYGTTRIGWSVGDSDTVKLTAESARVICILFYAAMVASVGVIGYFVHWMSPTYGADSSITRGIVLAGLTATPLYIFGAVGFYPVLWIDLLIGVVAISWSVYLLYLGMPIIMDIPEERGFLFASAVLGVCLVIFICVMVGSVILWEFGAAPAFTY